MRVLDTPITSISELKKSPATIIDKATDSNTGVYILNHNRPVAVVMAVDDYEKLVNDNDELLERLYDEEVANRLENQTGKTYSEAEVMGEAFANGKHEIDPDDGWE